MTAPSARVAVFVCQVIATVACGHPGSGGAAVTVGGSSSLYPLSEAVAESFLEMAPEQRVAVSVSGTAGGLRRLCEGDLDIAGASRRISAAEAERCGAMGFRYIEMPVARDGIVVAANTENDVVNCFTLEELRRLWGPDEAVRSWRDLRPDYPAETIRLFAPGPGSGTFRYFTSIVVGRPGAGRSDHYRTEDDDLIARGVAGDRWGLGYLGSAAYFRNRGHLRAIPVDTGFGCVPPTVEAVADGRYSPLARDLYIYVGLASLARDEVFALAGHYLGEAAILAVETGYVPLVESEYIRGRAAIAAAREGGPSGAGPSGTGGSSRPAGRPGAGGP